MSRRGVWCRVCLNRKAEEQWWLPMHLRNEVCVTCKAGPYKAKKRQHMNVYQTFDQVDRNLPNGTLIRILGNPDPYWDSVYRIRNGGSNAQGFVWGVRVFPGPMQYVPCTNSVVKPVRLRSWGDDVPSSYRITGVDDDENV